MINLELLQPDKDAYRVVCGYKYNGLTRYRIIDLYTYRSLDVSAISLCELMDSDDTYIIGAKNDAGQVVLSGCVRFFDLDTSPKDRQGIPNISISYDIVLKVDDEDAVMCGVSIMMTPNNDTGRVEPLCQSMEYLETEYKTRTNGAYTLKDIDIAIKYDSNDYEKINKQIKLMGISGMTLSRFNMCTLRNVKCKALAVPNGISAVIFEGGLDIEELTLPQTCKRVLGDLERMELSDGNSRIGRLVLGGVESMEEYCFANTRIRELVISKKLQAIGDGVFYYGSVNKIVGDIECDFIDHYAFTGCTLDVLDLSDCRIAEGEDKLFYDAHINKVILPKSLKYIHTKWLTDGKVDGFVFNGELKGIDDMDTAPMNNKGEHRYIGPIEVKNTPSHHVLEVFKDYGIKIIRKTVTGKIVPLN